MRLSEVFISGKKRQHRGHFANIVKIAKADNKVTSEEEVLLFKMAKTLNLSMSSFNRILENPDKYPINPPVNYEERITRLYSLCKMVLADGDVAKEEVNLLLKIAVGLGFSSKNVQKVCQKAIELVAAQIDLEDFIKEITIINRAK